MSWWNNFLERVRGGPEQRAAQGRLDDAQAAGGVGSREQAERLSDAVYDGRAADRAARGAGRASRSGRSGGGRGRGTSTTSFGTVTNSVIASGNGATVNYRGDGSRGPTGRPASSGPTTTARGSGSGPHNVGDLSGTVAAYGEGSTATGRVSDYEARASWVRDRMHEQSARDPRDRSDWEREWGERRAMGSDYEERASWVRDRMHEQLERDPRTRGDWEKEWNERVAMGARPEPTPKSEARSDNVPLHEQQGRTVDRADYTVGPETRWDGTYNGPALSEEAAAAWDGVPSSEENARVNQEHADWLAGPTPEERERLASRDAWVSEQFVDEFRHPGWEQAIERHYGLEPNDQFTQEHLQGYEAHRRAELEREWFAARTEETERAAGPTFEAEGRPEHDGMTIWDPELQDSRAMTDAEWDAFRAQADAPVELQPWQIEEDRLQDRQADYLAGLDPEEEEERRDAERAYRVGRPDEMQRTLPMPGDDHVVRVGWMEGASHDDLQDVANACAAADPAGVHDPGTPDGRLAHAIRTEQDSRAVAPVGADAVAAEGDPYPEHWHVHPEAAAAHNAAAVDAQMSADLSVYPDQERFDLAYWDRPGAELVEQGTPLLPPDPAPGYSAGPYTADESVAYLDSRPGPETPYRAAAEYGAVDYREPASQDEADARTSYVEEHYPATGWTAPPLSPEESAQVDADHDAYLDGLARVDEEPPGYAELVEVRDALAPAEPTAPDAGLDDGPAPAPTAETEAGA